MEGLDGIFVALRIVDKQRTGRELQIASPRRKISTKPCTGTFKSEPNEGNTARENKKGKSGIYIKEKCNKTQVRFSWLVCKIVATVLNTIHKRLFMYSASFAVYFGIPYGAYTPIQCSL